MTDTEHTARLERLRNQLRRRGVDGALVLRAIDVLYYAGTRQNAALWVPADGDPALLVRRSLSRAREESSVADVRPFPRSQDLPALFGRARRVGLFLDTLPVPVERYWRRGVGEREVVDLSEVQRDLRSVKSRLELDRMRTSASRLSAVLAEVPAFLRPGMREIDLAAEVEYRLRRAGHEGAVRLRAWNQELFGGTIVAGATAARAGYFDGPVVGWGLSAAAPQGASTAVIEKDVPIIVDQVGIWDGYLSDMTRTFVCGNLPTELTRAFQVTLDIQESIAEALRPGADGASLYARAVEMAGRAGLGSVFMGPPGEQARFVGHGVGLELDEWPVLAKGLPVRLEAGQTLAVEPKMVFPGLGAVGIENVFEVTASGGVRMSSLPDGLVAV